MPDSTTLCNIFTSPDCAKLVPVESRVSVGCAPQRNTPAGLRHHRAMVAARPLVLGRILTVRGVRCRVICIHPFGTIDVASLCGAYLWRVSGLASISA